ncbi:hypothetical protein HMPREF1991_02087 [Hoylesella loescheii DSM 19665 = JCM 12249 = ATCC 15930]|uniref:Uncharacterized protein n=1 Tax=Hoylesella loescheii DSM 19665 = JCM 12249 = ATCC 15930 TaxID=1122985 RepID=A0A069QG15_HOYLO|nr:hypothetical protein HMPREF1991_02087 [Hoylesella loescheii DSM 19665 = JCM 12249 = ATCC 15930]
MMNGRNVLFFCLLFRLFIDTLSFSCMLNCTHKQSISPYKLNNGKKTKTYGLVGL